MFVLSVAFWITRRQVVRLKRTGARFALRSLPQKIGRWCIRKVAAVGEGTGVLVPRQKGQRFRRGKENPTWRSGWTRNGCVSWARLACGSVRGRARRRLATTWCGERRIVPRARNVRAARRSKSGDSGLRQDGLRPQEAQKRGRRNSRMAKRDWRHLCVVYVFTHRPFVTRLDERAERSERKDAISRENRAARSSEAE